MSYARPTLLLALLTLVMVIVLAACGGDEGTPQFTVDEQVQATCSDECAAHGQCGALDSNALAGDSRAVLAMEAGPAVSLHDRFFTEGTLLTVIELSQRELISASGGAPLIGVATPFPHTFYRVTGEGKTAWVSEWCLVRP